MKRQINLDIVDNMLKCMKIKELQDNFDDLDDLILDMEMSSVKSSEEEYELLFTSWKYIYDENTIDNFLEKSVKRFQRYLKAVNFYADGYASMRDEIEKFLNTFPINNKYKNLENVKNLDLMIINIIEQLSE